MVVEGTKCYLFKTLQEPSTLKQLMLSLSQESCPRINVKVEKVTEKNNQKQEKYNQYVRI